MPLGPGKYDDLCTFVRLKTRADGVILLVLGGENGSGFSVQCIERIAPAQLAEMLEEIAAEIRKSTPEEN